MPPKKNATAAATAKPKKASSKHKIVAVVTSDGIQGSFQQESTPKKPIIVHLPIQSHMVHFHEQPINYDPNPPSDCLAYNDGFMDPFEEDCGLFEGGAVATTPVIGEEKEIDNSERVVEMEKLKEIINKPSPAPITQAKAEKQAASKHAKEYGPTKLLVQFENMKTTKQLPESTNVACFWTCEPFEGRPCVIPICIIDDVWQVYGNYCNPQTAMAALLAEPLDTHVRWERIALMNMLYGGAFAHGRIYPAPDRAVLQRFGGPMSVDEYRDLCDRGRLRADINYPPMVSILASMDTKPIDFYESSLGYTTASVPNAQVESTSAPSAAQLKLKRSKPLKDREHTLDNILNLQIKSR